MQDSQLKPHAQLALGNLQRLKKEYEEELLSAKEIVRILHDTSELIIVTVARVNLGSDEVVKSFLEDVKRSTNLLHGTTGWLFELLTAEEIEKKGYLPFVTFGTNFDANGFDVIAIPKKLARSKLKWNIKLSKNKK
jgi:hypothetical protein